MHRAAIALGSNLGDREAHLRFAVERLRALLTDLRVSTFLETEPEGVNEPQPAYLNGAVVGESGLVAHALLDELLRIEVARGRARPALRAPRTLDLDLILYGDEIIDTADLVVPHPRFRERWFVLNPLAEIAGDWIDPVSGRTVASFARAASPHGR